jgi:anti-sigma B factor antagonist
MELIYDENSHSPKRIVLRGRLDLKGCGEIDLRLTSLTSTDDSLVLIDMREVDFIASLGMRLLLTCAKAKAARGGRMALFGLQPMVLEALESAGLNSLIPFFSDEQSALADLPG